MRFQYRAIDKSGQEVHGVSEAVDRFALAREMRMRNLTLASAVPEKKAGDSFFNLRRLGELVFGRVRMKDKIVFAGSLSAMISAGLSLSRALRVMEKQATGAFKKVLVELVEQVNRGASLSQGLSSFPGVFPPVFVAMAAAGEESGNLSQSLEITRQQLARGYDLLRKVRGAMIYPAIILSLIVVIGVLMMMFVVPTISRIFEDFEADLPFSTQVVIGVSNFIAHQTVLFFAIVLSVVVFFVGFFKSRSGRHLFATLLLRAPIFSTLVKNYNSAVIMRTLSSLISSGVGMVEAIEITSQVIQNPHYREVLSGSAEKVQKGRPLSETFKEYEKLFPVFVGEMAEVGEESGNLAKMLMRGAVFFEEEVEQTTKNLSTVIEPALMILVGAAVGFFAVAIIGPIYSLSNVF